MKGCRCRLLALLLMLPLLSGCWDRTEINDLAFVLTTGWDLEEDGQIRCSVLVPLPGQMGGPSGGGGGSSGGKSFYIDSEVGPTFRDAQAKLQRRMSRRMFVAHRRTLLISEELAKKGIREVFDSTSRSPESRMTTYMVITSGKAYDLLNATPKFERFSSEAIRELAKSKTIIDMNMKAVAVELSTPGMDPVVPYMGVKPSEKGEKPSKEVEALGYAQFKDDKLTGILQDKAAYGLAWLKKKNVNVTASLKLPDGATVTVRFFNMNSHIKPRLTGGRLRYEIRAFAMARVAESTGMTDFSQSSVVRKLENAMNDYVKESIRATLEQAKKYHADSAELGAYLWRAYPSVWKNQYSADWPKGLDDAEFDIQAKTVLNETGLIYENVAKGERDK